MMKMEDNQKYTMKIELEVHYDDQFLEDIIVTALEGGSNYWIDYIKGFKNEKPKDIPTSIWVFNELKNGKMITICMENDQRVFLTMRKLQYGVKKYFSDTSNLIDGLTLTLDAGDYDANMADCVLQYAVFNELIYG